MDVLDLIGEPAAPAARSEAAFVAFADWQPKEREALARLGAVEAFDAGTTVIAAGAPDRSLLIVLEGELEVVRGGHVVHRVVPGDLVGELAFVDGLPRSASVRAVGAAKALRVRPEDVQRLAQDEPAVALKFVWEVARILAARLRGAWG
jgi:CRP-like cAMP-binding protein